MNTILPDKIDNTEAFAAMFKKLRTETPKNGKILTSQELSLIVYPKNRAWVSQIENRRLKKVKSQDMIAVYECLFDEDYDTAKEHFEADYENYSTKQEQFDKITSLLLNTLYTKYNVLKSPSDRDDLCNVLSCLNSGFSQNYRDTVFILNNMNFSSLKDALEVDHSRIMNQLINLKYEINSFGKKAKLSRVCELIHGLIDTYTLKTANPMTESLKNAYVYISDGYKYMKLLLQLSDDLSVSYEKFQLIHTLSVFIITVNKVASDYFPNVLPLEPSKLTEESTNVEISKVIKTILKHLDELESHFNENDLFLWLLEK